MSGIYIHIPFCKSKCYYCDFYSVTRGGGETDFIDALLKEMEFRREYLPGGPVETIYFGGGTPTLLPPERLGIVIERLRQLFTVTPDAEITLEANPDDLTADLLRAFLLIGFNRISIGIQSFHDAHLRYMNRRHDARQAIESVHLAHAAGFRRVSTDLIYGIPGMSAEEWELNLDTALKLPAGHLSAYHLTIEPATRFGRLHRSGLFTEVADELSIEQYRTLLERTAAHGFEQYEISNFARNGEYSRHNGSYWTGRPYLGLGPSAHSFNGTHRHWNSPTLAAYLRDIRDGKLPKGEHIDPVMHRNEYVMTTLRTAAGIRGADYRSEFGEESWKSLLVAAEPHIRMGRLILEPDRLCFDRMAWFLSDGVLADLFLEG